MPVCICFLYWFFDMNSWAMSIVWSDWPTMVNSQITTYTCNIQICCTLIFTSVHNHWWWPMLPKVEFVANCLYKVTATECVTQKLRYICSFHKTIVQKLWVRTTPQIAFLRDSSWPIFIILLHCWETLCKQVCSARVRILQKIWAWTNYSPIVTEQFLSPKQTKRMSVEARKCTLRPAEKFQPQLSKSGNVPSLIASGPRKLL